MVRKAPAIICVLGTQAEEYQSPYYGHGKTTFVAVQSSAATAPTRKITTVMGHLTSSSRRRPRLAEYGPAAIDRGSEALVARSGLHWQALMVPERGSQSSFAHLTALKALLHPMQYHHLASDFVRATAASAPCQSK
jgi:hypothetical protein